MKSATLLVFTTFLFLMSTTQVKADGGGIQFEHMTWEEVKQKAKAENKLIFVDAFTTWCGPCKWMAANVFTDKEVGDFYNANFINFKYDMEKGEGPKFAREYRVRAYPTLLFIDGDGELVHQVVGAQDAEKFIAFGKDALDPTKQTSALKKKYLNGERSPAFMLQYLGALSSANQKTDQIAMDYLRNIEREKWSESENWEIISNHLANSSNDVYNYVATNRETFSAYDADGQVKDYLVSGMMNDIRRVIQSQDEPQLKSFKSKCLDILPGIEGEETIALTEMYFYQGDAQKSHVYAANYLDNYCEDQSALNSFAWRYFENEEDKEKLNKALEWVNKSISLDKNFYNMDTKANLLHKLGKSEEALFYANEAVELGKAVGENTTETERLVDEIKRNL